MIIPNTEGEWKPARPLIKYPLGQGYSLVIKNRFELFEKFEGFIITSHNEWVLYQNQTELTSFIKEHGADPEQIFNETLPYLPPESRETMRWNFYITQDTTRKEAIAKRAKKIWESGKALEFLEQTVQNKHVGDKEAIRAMILSYVSIRVENCEGIHISLSGDTGTGKSHLINSVLSILPEHASIDARFSDKALYHHKIPAGSVLVVDDQHLSEDFAELFKNASTDWDKPSKYLSVAKNEAVTLYLPERCVYWISKANLNGDEQVLDRQIVLWTDSSDEQRHAVHLRLLEAVANPKKVIEENYDKEICHAVFAFLDRETVRIPFSSQIRCNYSMDPRTMNIMLTLIQTHALLCSPQRKRDADGIIEAELEDFYGAMFVLEPLFANQKGSQSLKLSSGSAKVLDFLKTKPSGLVPLSDIMRACSMSNASLSHALWGRAERGVDGLFAVCPSVELVTQTESEMDGESCDRRRSVTRKMIRWSRESYEAWIARMRGGFWIDAIV